MTRINLPVVFDYTKVITFDGVKLKARIDEDTGLEFSLGYGLRWSVSYDRLTLFSEKGPEDQYEYANYITYHISEPKQNWLS
jgi:hypothetical protein